VRVLGFIFLLLLTVACILVKERLPPRKGAFFIPSAFTQLSYVFTTAGLFLTVWGLYTPFYYIATYGLEHGMSTQLAYYTVAILNSTSFFGRVIPGFLADKFGVFNIVIQVAISTSILEFCWIATSSNAGIIAFAAVYGFCSGAVISLFGTCTAVVTPMPSQIGTYMVGFNVLLGIGSAN
jgi:predicted MFS family arabinose efflux permease